VPAGSSHFSQRIQREHHRTSGEGQTFHPAAAEVTAQLAAGYRIATRKSDEGDDDRVVGRAIQVRVPLRNPGGVAPGVKGEELVAREPVASVLAACQRAKELCDMLMWEREQWA
jgi:hypothetical protein